MAITQTTNFSSASVLPSFYNKGEKETYYLIAKERGKDEWADFGGKSERNDLRPSVTAIREFKEETIGALTNAQNNIGNGLRHTFKIQVGGHVLYVTALNPGQKKWLKQYTFTQVCNMRADHQKRLKKGGLSSCQKEKTELAWIRAKDIVAQSFIAKNGQMKLRNNFTLYKQPHKGSGKIDNASLRPCMITFLSRVLHRKYLSDLQNGFYSYHGQQEKV